MQSIIISGGYPDDRQTKISQYLNLWGINSFDCIVLKPGDEQLSIGIGEVKNMIRSLNRTPQFSQFSVALIRNADLLTTEAQNALLKTLEEPPPHARIIIECGSTDALLSTIRSRCFDVALPKLSRNSPLTEIDNLTELISGSTGKKLTLAESAAAKQGNVPDFIANLTITLHAILLGQQGIGDYPKTETDINLSSGKIRKILENIIRTNRYLEANINPKTALDSVFI